MYSPRARRKEGESDFMLMRRFVWFTKKDGMRARQSKEELIKDYERSVSTWAT